MLQITTQPVEFFDEKTQEFINKKAQVLQLEHSLISISKWEQKWHKAFLTNKEKSLEETIDYIRCMTLNRDVDPFCYYFISSEDIDRIDQYISDSMTATYFRDDKTPNRSSEVVTSELIYYWMISLNIPFECQKWHLNRLLTLIKVCQIKNSPPKKRSKREIMAQNAALNAARRKRLNSKG